MKTPKKLLAGALLVGVGLQQVLSAGAGATAEQLVKYQLKTLSLSVPAAWENTVEDGSQKFTAPSNEAFFLLDVGAVQTAGMRPQECLQQILTSIGGEGWQKLSLGANPGARRVEADTAGAGKETHTYVGCNGKTTWSLVFSMDQTQKARFEPLALQIAQSVSYSRGR